MRINIPLKDAEVQRLCELAEEQEMSVERVMVQALRLYADDHAKRSRGETVKWSGDADRAARFAGFVS